MTQPIALALAQMSDPPFRRVLIKSLLLTALVYAACGAAAWWGFGLLPENWGWVPWEWLQVALDWLAGGAFIFLLIVLFPAVATLSVGLFLDEIAGAVEARHYPNDVPGKETPVGDSLLLGVRFTGALVALNLAVVPLYFLTFWIPFVGVIIFYGLNGYLLGREYFELVAQRHGTPVEVRKLRKLFRNSILWRGVIIAVLLMVPVVNFVVPLFATAWLVHIFKRLERQAQDEFGAVG